MCTQRLALSSSVVGISVTLVSCVVFEYLNARVRGLFMKVRVPIEHTDDVYRSMENENFIPPSIFG